MKPQSRPVDRWMLLLMICCPLVAVVLVAGSPLLQQYRAGSQHLRISISAADGKPVDVATIKLRLPHATFSLDRIVREENGVLRASVGSLEADLHREELATDWFEHGRGTLQVTSTSHGTIETAIGSHDVNLTLAAPAFASITLEPPLTPSRTHTYELWVTATERQHPDVRLDLRPRDGDPNTPIRFGPVQPGRFRLAVHRVPRETPGAQFHGWGTNGNSEHDRIVDLVSGGNELR